MRRIPIGLLLWIAFVLIVAGFIALPMIEQEKMRTPLVGAVNALKRQDLDGLRACFAPDATVTYRAQSVPAAELITAIEPLLREEPIRDSVRVDPYRNVKRTGALVEADVTLRFFVDGGGELPYRRVPLERRAHVTLEEQSWLRWKIKDLRSDADELEMAFPEGGR